MKIKYLNNEYNVCFNKYYNGRIAMLLFDDEGIYGTVTVNIDEPITNENCSYIDTNNWDESIINSIFQLGFFTGKYGQSGFCSYPEFEFYKQCLESEE